MVQGSERPTRSRLDTCCEWLDRKMAYVYGDGDRAPVEQPRPRSSDRLAGVEGRYVVRRDDGGNSYLSAA